MPGLETWWRDTEALHRYVVDLVHDELARLRPGALPPARPWDSALGLVDSTGLACDSLELLNLASAVAEAVQMHRAGVEDYLLARRTIGDWVDIVAAGLERFSDELTFRTSGTTAEPTARLHELVRLAQEVEELAPLFPGRLRILSAAPAHHIYGFLFSILLPQRLAARVIDIRGRSPTSVGAMLRDGDLVIGHPAFWTAFVRAGVATTSDVIGVTSTGPCPADVARAVTERGVARLVEVYGSSETAGLAVREHPEAAFGLFSYWSRGRDDSTLARTLPDGSVETAAAPDHLAWCDDRCFRVEGRRDHAVQVGGVNVSPELVAQRLREHPMVQDVAVRLMRPEEGARLKAFIVPVSPPPDVVALRRDLAAWCDARFSVPERPKAFNLGPELPRGALGKPADWSVFEEARRGEDTEGE
ncbi:AMP-binding protein [Phenylobacterium sp.]|uniref:AMP-binding protein n=1 Tax=Phenylobacterium sp. TaxID=1871053 RepID=UPI00286E3A27|nr:AMP-binding protein [Phenylobacterium sp.]